MKALAVVLAILLLTSAALADISADVSASAEGSDALAIAAVSGSVDSVGAFAYASGINATASGNVSATGQCVWWNVDTSSGSYDGYTMDAFSQTFYEFTDEGIVWVSFGITTTYYGGACTPHFRGMWIFGQSDVERYWHFKGQEKLNCDDPTNATCIRARYFMPIILDEHRAHSALEFETKHPIDEVFKMRKLFQNFK